MITFKPIIIPGGRRKDGIWPVKIRVTFKGVSRRLPTTLTCTDADLTRSGRIKNATTLQKAGELIARMRTATEELSPFTLEAWDVDKVVDHIRTSLTSQSFRLDLFTYADGYLKSKSPGTRKIYDTALRALERFLGRRTLDVNDITRRLLLDFVAFIEAEPRMKRQKDGTYKPTSVTKKAGGASAVHLAKLANIYNQAKYEYNDEDSGRILIPRSPFDGLDKAYPPGQGQHALPQEVMQRVIDATTDSEAERIALDLFVVSFGLMGANLADLYAARDVSGSVWTYNRQKTATRRVDRAEVRVAIPAELSSFLGRLGGQSAGVWLPALRRWGKENTAVMMVNRALRSWCEAEGLEPFTFYAARKTYATLCRKIGVEKATVDEALGHVGEFRLTDIYAERNWQLAWDATRKVLNLFRWPSDNNGTKTEHTDGSGV